MGREHSIETRKAKRFTFVAVAPGGYCAICP